ncbi:MAG: phosphotransferase family protein [Ilumatobacteraceae bacterium]
MSSNDRSSQTEVTGIDHVRVSRWLSDNIDGLDPPFVFHPIEGGRSNLTYRVVDGAGYTVVLRRPPLGHVLATAHDMAREYKIIAAVGKTQVPIPRALGLCVDETVNGAPFYVMSFVGGAVLDSPASAEQLTFELRRTASEHLFDVLAELHQVDIDAIGLGDLAKRTGYIERQLKRWSTQWNQSKTREFPAVEEAERLLRERIPEQLGVSIAHGDYRFGNCLTDLATGRITAVLDWELCTLGDPLADLGHLGIYWTDPGSGLGRHNDPTGAPGFPTYAEMVQRYATRTGRDVSNVAFYRAFAAWRLAIVSEGVYARYMYGAMGESTLDLSALKQGTEDLATTALVALKGASR